MNVSESEDDLLRQIEENQAALRKSIEHSRDLADKSQELLDKHRSMQTEED
jgi:hypothetical protein